jgi:hypothetical protein
MAIDGMTRSNAYSDRELERLHDHENDTTRGALNQLGGHAGLTQNYNVRGDDRSEREIVADHRSTVAREGLEGVALEGKDAVVDHVAEHVAEAEVGLALLPITLLKAGYEALKSVAEDNKVGHERAAALTKDAMHIVMMENLNGLPTEYVTSQLARYTESEKGSTLVRNMNLALGRDSDHQAMLTVQLHCDQGMSAARGMCDAKLDAKTFFAAHPDIAKRCADDPAFKAGFDGVVWAKQNGPDAYGAVIKELEARDVRYEQAHVAWRV